jgi:hypothetical protein
VNWKSPNGPVIDFVRSNSSSASRAAAHREIAAVSQASGMELAGAIDTQFIGQDAWKVLVVATNVMFPLCSWFPSLQIASTGVVLHQLLHQKKTLQKFC